MDPDHGKWGALFDWDGVVTTSEIAPTQKKSTPNRGSMPKISWMA